jgi:hypothetical protein
MRPPVTAEGNNSGEVVTGWPAMTARIRSVNGTSCCSPVFGVLGHDHDTIGEEVAAAFEPSKLAAAQAREQGQADQAPKLPKLSALCHSVLISSSLKARPPLAAAASRSARELRRPASTLLWARPVLTDHSRKTRRYLRRSLAAPGRPSF